MSPATYLILFHNYQARLSCFRYVSKSWTLSPALYMYVVYTDTGSTRLLVGLEAWLSPGHKWTNGHLKNSAIWSLLQNFGKRLLAHFQRWALASSTEFIQQICQLQMHQEGCSWLGLCYGDSGVGTRRCHWQRELALNVNDPFAKLLVVFR